jgi:hypothetical protein
MLYTTIIPTVLALNLIIALYAIVRVISLTKLTKKLTYSEVVDLESDVSTLKLQLKKLNGRLSGLESPKYDSLAEARELMQQTVMNSSNHSKNLNGVSPPQNRGG